MKMFFNLLALSFILNAAPVSAEEAQESFKPLRFNREEHEAARLVKDCVKKVGSFLLPLEQLEKFLGHDCFGARPSSKELGFVVNTDYVLADSETCSCLESNKFNQSYINEKRRSSKLKDDAFTLRMIEANAKEKQQRYMNMIEGMTVQSWLISEDKAFTASYIQPPERGEAKVKFSRLLNSSKEILKKNGAALLVEERPQFRKKLESDLSRISNLIKGPFSETNNPYPSNVITPPGCFSMQSFMAFKQLPTEKAFFQDLGKMNRFKEEDWDLEKLSHQYDEAYIKADKALRNGSPESSALLAKSDALKARILFLNRNPLFANLLGADLPKSDKSKAEMIMARKTQLFNIIKQNFPVKEECDFKDGACLKFFYGNQEQYNAEIKKLFKEVDVLETTRIEAYRKLVKELKETSGLTETRLPRTQSAMEKKFKTITNGRSIEHCSSNDDKFDMPSCVENFANYCTMLWGSGHDINDPENQQAFVSPSATLARDMEFDFSIDPKKNTAFQRLSEELCQTPRVSKTDPAQKATFHDFAKKHCSIEANKKDCENPESTLKTYLQKYDLPGINTAEKIEAKLKGEAFATLLEKNTDAKTLTDEEVRGIQSKAVTNSEIKRNGASRYISFFDSAKDPVSAVVKNPSVSTPAETNSPAPTSNASSSREEAPFNFIPNATPGAQAAMSLPELKKAKDEAAIERTHVNEELLEARRELAEARAEKDRLATRELENRIKHLEDLLAQKDKVASETQKALEEKTKEEQGIKNKSKTATSTKVANSDSETKNQTEVSPLSATESYARAPASIPDHTNINGAAFNKAPSSVPSSSETPGAAKIAPGSSTNSAFLAKYGISVSGAADELVQVATERDPKALKLLAADQDGASIPLDVSAAEFAKFKNNDLETLSRVYSTRFKQAPGTILKLVVTTKNQKGTLEFYAVRSGGKVIFQPVRKYRREDLKSYF